MIGIVIVTHSQLGDALIGAAEFIIGSRPEAMESVSIDLSENADKLRSKIARGIKKVEGQEGILILTDMFGGTPSNLAISLLDRANVEVIAGMNLPMLIKLAKVRERDDLADAVARAQESGRKYINVASTLLTGEGQ
jgi:PTS system mannose-specific IIA component